MLQNLLVAPLGDGDDGEVVGDGEGLGELELDGGDDVAGGVLLLLASTVMASFIP